MHESSSTPKTATHSNNLLCERRKKRLWTIPPGSSVNPQYPEIIYYLIPPGSYSLQVVVCLDNVAKAIEAERQSRGGPAVNYTASQRAVFKAIANSRGSTFEVFDEYSTTVYAQADGRKGGSKIPSMFFLGRTYQEFDRIPMEARRWFSRKHCCINWRYDGLNLGEATFVLIDLGSANGTYLNGRPLSYGTAQPLQSGDLIGVSMTASGELMLGFRFIVHYLACRTRGLEPVNPLYSSGHPVRNEAKSNMQLDKQQRNLNYPISDQCPQPKSVISSNPQQFFSNSTTTVSCQCLDCSLDTLWYECKTNSDDQNSITSTKSNDEQQAKGTHTKIENYKKNELLLSEMKQQETVTLSEGNETENLKNSYCDGNTSSSISGYCPELISSQREIFEDVKRLLVLGGARHNRSIGKKPTRAKRGLVLGRRRKRLETPQRKLSYRYGVINTTSHQDDEATENTNHAPHNQHDQQHNNNNHSKAYANTNSLEVAPPVKLSLPHKFSLHSKWTDSSSSGTSFTKRVRTKIRFSETSEKSTTNRDRCNISLRAEKIRNHNSMSSPTLNVAENSEESCFSFVENDAEQHHTIKTSEDWKENTNHNSSGFLLGVVKKLNMSRRRKSHPVVASATLYH